MVNIVQANSPILHKKAYPVHMQDIGSIKINNVISDMQIAMASQKDGIAIAAPQIGESLCIFVVNGTLLKLADKTYKGDSNNMIFINPKIIKKSRDKKEVEEGCLSVRWLYGKVRRSTRVTLQALNEKGEVIERGASGLLAQIFQHEVDHLEGILFVDKARELWELSPDEISELKK